MVNRERKGGGLMEEKIFDSLETAWRKAIKDLKDERINAVEIHWGMVRQHSYKRQRMILKNLTRGG